jgi:NAD(P)-dependent dehydrogenase (short-subunit alcohol dehydrogenase family)
MNALNDAPLAVVTGGSRGIGRAVVHRLAAQGWAVVAVARDADALAVTSTSAPSGTVWHRRCDVTDENEVGRLFDEFGPIDVLVSNAGVSTAAPLARSTLADWEHQLRVNATGTFLCVRAVLPGMHERDRGRIVTVASTAGLSGAPYIAGYAASKHAVIGLMRVTAAEVAGTGVTANAVCPSFVRSDMTDRSVERIAEATERSREEALGGLLAASPLGRLIEPEEVAAAVAYLCSADAGAVNGQTIVIDGGASTT